MFSNTTATWAEAEVFCLYNVIDWTKEVNQFINHFDLKKKKKQRKPIFLIEYILDQLKNRIEILILQVFSPKTSSDFIVQQLNIVKN